jgi:oligopeptide transport system ATP-binding protein
MAERGADGALLEVEGLQKHFLLKGSWITGRPSETVRAVDGVDFRLDAGETLALVGESGCGKTTTARLVLRLLEPTAGSIRFGGRDITRLGRAALKPIRREMQVVFQDPYASLSPRLNVEQIVGEPMRVHGVGGTHVERRRLIGDMLERVGLDRDRMAQFPRQFSGGQRQRIGIARALALHPRLIVADEPVSALDVSVRAQIVNLLDDLQRELDLAYLFIAHDLAVVRHFAHRVAVMYLGVVVEEGPTDRLFRSPHHPYTEALLSAVPVPDPKAAQRRIVLEGETPSPKQIPPGCRFHTRCPIATEICARIEPPAEAVASGHLVACHHAKAFPVRGAPTAEPTPIPARTEGAPDG